MSKELKGELTDLETIMKNNPDVSSFTSKELPEELFFDPSGECFSEEEKEDIKKDFKEEKKELPKKKKHSPWHTRSRNWKAKTISKERYDSFSGDENGFYTHNLHQFIGLDFTKDYAMTKTANSKGFKTFKGPVTNIVKSEHYLDETNIAVRRFPSSSIVYIDIDDPKDNNNKSELIVDKVVELLGEPALIEYSKASNGYHLIYKFDCIVLDSALKFLEAFFLENYGYVIEPIHGDKKIRLPGSKKYKEHLGTYDKTHPYRVSNIRERNVKGICQTMEEAEELPLPSKLKKFNKRGEAIKPVVTEMVDYEEKDFNYGCGTRYHTQLKIAFYCIGKEYDFNEFMRLCDYYNDGTSKDMVAWGQGYTKIKNLHKTYSYAKEKFNDEFQYKKNPLEDKDQLIYDEDYEIFNGNNHKYDKLKEILNAVYRKNNIGKIDGKVQKKTVYGAILLFERVLERQEYEKEVDRHYDENFLQPLNEGVLFAQETIERFGEELSIRNVKKSWDLLELSGLIEPIYMEIEYGGKKLLVNHSFYYNGLRWAKHYLINSLYRVYKLIIRYIINGTSLVSASNIRYTVPFFYSSLQGYTTRGENINIHDPGGG